MDPCTLDHLSDEALFRSLSAAVSRARINMAELLSHLAEFDARRLYASAGYPSMFAYCVEVLHFSEPEAARRIQAARAVRRFPTLLPALSSGRLHLTAIGLLAPHLSQENADELIESATHRSKYAIETLLARRFPESLPKVGVAVWIRPVAQRPVPQAEVVAQPLFDSSPAVQQETPSRQALPSPEAPELYPPDESPREPSLSGDNPGTDVVPTRPKEHLPGDVLTPVCRSPADATPASPCESSARPEMPELFLIRVTVPRGTYDKLREAQVLLSHAVRAQDLAQVLDRALDALIAMLRRRKLGVSPISSRRAERPAKGGRHIPSHIRHAVWKRDGGQCTFVSADGHRCQERRYLEFDHVEPVARGGTALVDTVRLRCRTHNQLEAERAFGAAFMDKKRREARDGRARDR